MFKITFDNRIIFTGRSIPSSDWGKWEDRPIQRMEYQVGAKTFTFEGFHRYNHLIENVGFGVHGVTKIFLMASDNKKTFILTIDFIQKKIHTNVVECGHEYGKQKLPGWKEGVKGIPVVHEKSSNLVKKLYPN